MIVKYWNAENDAWGFIDNVRQVAYRPIDCDKLVKEYNDKLEAENAEAIKKGWPVPYDDKMCNDGEPLPVEIQISNKVFLQATKSSAEWGRDVHCENLIDGAVAISSSYGVVVLIYIEECKDYDTIALITNQKCYLLNDRGQTVERIY